MSWIDTTGYKEDILPLFSKDLRKHFRFVCTNSRHPGMNIRFEFPLFRTIFSRLRVCCGSQPSQPRPGSGENRRTFATSAFSHPTCLPCQVRFFTSDSQNWLPTFQFCGSGMFVPDPGSWLLSFPDSGNKSNERGGGGGGDFVILPFFVATNITKLWIIEPIH